MKNVEIKAYCRDPERIRKYLQDKNADFKGTDRQIDTYFNVSEGRLKLREGNIEKHLIFYKRPDSHGPKRSDVILYQPSDTGMLKNILTASLGIRVVVDKKREIYFIDNVKFHIDTVQGLGSFVEIEAQDYDGTKSEEFLRQQCDFYLHELGIPAENLISHSYSDMLLDRQKGK